MKKKVDSRIRTAIENAVKTKQRNFFVIVGDRGREQVVNIHYMLSKAVVKTRPSVLWCYKKELGFSSHKQKRMKQIKKQIQRGLYDPNTDDPFELFVSSTNIRYCYYKETQNILGNTFGMCVLQDFEALTPNLLCRTIETVEGGGVVVLLLKTMSSLKQLYSLTMDVHQRFATEAHQDVEPRFNERFILSLGSCANCLVMDDELNILPISSHSRNIVPVSLPGAEDGAEAGADVYLTPAEKELKDLKISLKDTQPVGSLVSAAKTLDQAKAVMVFVEAISEKTLRSTVALTAARGRGKSSALGLAMAAAVAYGYANIFVTAPSPENLKTLFEFVFKGFDALDYKEHLDYELVQSTNPEYNKAVVRVNIFRSHRQTIQYIVPQDHQKLGQAELLVIDEAAAIPLPLVKKLLGPYLVFMASTVTGYEGTGRSLSLKLIEQLRQQNRATGKDAVQTSTGGRVLREIALEEPIRYASGDTVEKWMHELLCLDATSPPRLLGGCPHPSQCDLYYVNRDTLFSYHKASEGFLHRMMSLYVSSHYKNTPNDLQLMSDAPAHHLFVLLGPVQESTNGLPDIVAVIQVCLEGEISRQSVVNSMSRGIRPSGDLIPWTVSEQFQDNDFPLLNGARIVRIATHPDLQKMGYGQRAMELLTRYYQGEITGLNEDEEMDEQTTDSKSKTANGSADLSTEKLKPRGHRKPLLQRLSERRPEKMHYIGVSYGLTENLFKFWKKSGFEPVYVRQTANDLTGEHTCIMLKPLKTDEIAVTGLNRNDHGAWLQSFTEDFKKRFISLLSFEFRSFKAALALAVLDPKVVTNADNSDSVTQVFSKHELELFFSTYDMKRLESYAKNMVDYHMIMDLVPNISRLYFLKKFGELSFSYAQAAILLGMGLQHKTIDDIQEELSVPGSQLLALFNKSIRKVSSLFRSIETKAIEATMSAPKQVSLRPLNESLADDLEEGGQKASKDLKDKQQSLLMDMDLSQFAIPASGDFDEAVQSAGKRGGQPTSVSVKSSKKHARDEDGTSSKKSKVDGREKEKSHKQKKHKRNIEQ
eukprot:GILK01005037.1.p1 GENE.GILK01005037.1~~GILK01005037.1.p1  ORF type:complete len:1046 (-),score=256.41 GILK01005037.1:107-3244(-)